MELSSTGQPGWFLAGPREIKTTPSCLSLCSLPGMKVKITQAEACATEGELDAQTYVEERAKGAIGRRYVIPGNMKTD